MGQSRIGVPPLNRYTIPLQPLLFFTAFASLFLSCAIAHADVPPPPFYLFTEINLPTDTASLITFLESGITADAATRLEAKVNLWQSNGDWKKRLLPMYTEAVAALGDRKATEAAPLLIAFLAEPLPTHIATATNAAYNPAQSALGFQAECAIALAHMNAQDALPAINARLKSVSEHIVAACNAHDGILARRDEVAFRRLCIALVALGDNGGVEYALALLPHVEPETLPPHFPVSTLTQITGQYFGPADDLPARLWPAEFAKWTAWWAENKSTFAPDRTALANEVRSARRPDPNPLREQLLLAPFGIDIVPSSELNREGMLAKDWLTQNAKKHTKELRAFMDNPDEQLGVRVEAMKWHAHAKGKGAQRALRPYADGKIPFDPADHSHQERLRETAQEIIDKEPRTK